MSDRNYARLFDVAFSLVADADVDRKKEIARRCANAVLAGLSRGMTKEDETELRVKLAKDLGVRGAAALIDAARPLKQAPATRKWQPTGAPKIAIITGSETAAEADELYARLTSIGATCWFYGRSIRVGRRIRKEDENALQVADYIVFLVTRDALRANWVDWELDLVHWLEMQERRERLLPVIVDDLTFDELPPLLGPLFTLSWSALGAEGVVSEIVERVDEDVARIKKESAKR